MVAACPKTYLFILLQAWTISERLVLVSFWYCALTGCSRYPYSSMMRYPLLAALRPPVLVSYWRPIQIWCTILSWLPCLILSCIRFILNPYSNMMLYPLLAALPPAVLVYYQVLIKIWCNILSSLPCPHRKSCKRQWLFNELILCVVQITRKTILF